MVQKHAVFIAHLALAFISLDSLYSVVPGTLAQQLIFTTILNCDV